MCQSKYKPEYDEQAYKLSLLGMTDEELATFFDIKVTTLNNWKTKYKNFRVSIKKGKDIADGNVVDRLYQRAMGYSHEEVITASYQGQITDTMIVTKHYPPDTTAAMAWLKNRRRKSEQNWNASDKHEHQVTTDKKFEDFFKE